MHWFLQDRLSSMEKVDSRRSHAITDNSLFEMWTDRLGPKSSSLLFSVSQTAERQKRLSSSLCTVWKTRWDPAQACWSSSAAVTANMAGACQRGWWAYFG